MTNPDEGQTFNCGVERCLFILSEFAVASDGSARWGGEGDVQGWLRASRGASMSWDAQCIDCGSRYGRRAEQGEWCLSWTRH